MMKKSQQTFKERELEALQYLVDYPLKPMGFNFKVPSTFLYDKAVEMVWQGEPINAPQKVFKDLLNGLSMKALAAKNNCTIQTIGNRIKAAKAEIIEAIEAKVKKGELKLSETAKDPMIIEWMTEKRRKRKVDFYRMAKAYRYYFPRYSTDDLEFGLNLKPMSRSFHAHIIAIRWKDRDITEHEAIFMKFLQGKTRKMIMKEHPLGSANAVSKIINAVLLEITESIEKDIADGILKYPNPMPQPIPLSSFTQVKEIGEISSVSIEVLSELIRRYMAN